MHLTVNVGPTDNVTSITEDDIKQIVGQWYDQTVFDDPRSASAYAMIARINEVWYDQIPVTVEWQTEDPYDSYADMRDTVDREGKLRVFSGGSEPLHMTHEQNVKGRAVHDWFGHLEADCDFSMKGEWEKFDYVKHRYPEKVRPLLFTEIVGQRAAASYYDDGFGDDRFFQRASFAPKYIMDLCKRAFS